jgi:methionyl-tRNA formyltransferase
MKKIAFLGTKDIGYYCLEHLLLNAEKLDAEVVAVLTNERRSILGNDISINDLCKKFNAPVFESLEQLLSIPDFDILISIQYHLILNEQYFGKAKQIAVNLHMAPLPEYRGCNQFSFAIIDGAKEFGTTIHRLEERADSGAIMFERRFRIPEDCFVKDLYNKTFEQSLLLFEESLPKIVSEEYAFMPQERLVRFRGTSFHFRKEIEKIKEIDLSWEREKIFRHFRATYFPPFEPPYAVKNGEKISITPEWIKDNLS